MWASIGTGAGLITLFVVFYWLGIFAKTRALFAFLGVCLLVGGIVGRILTAAATWIAQLSDKLASALFGVAGGITLISVVLAIIFIHDMLPRNRAGKRTAFIGIALAAIMTAGVSGISAFDNVPGQVQQGVNNAKQVVGG